MKRFREWSFGPRVVVPRFLIVKCSNCSTSESGNKSDHNTSGYGNDDGANANAYGGTGRTGSLQIDEELMS